MVCEIGQDLRVVCGTNLFRCYGAPSGKQATVFPSVTPDKCGRWCVYSCKYHPTRPRPHSTPACVTKCLHSPTVFPEPGFTSAQLLCAYVVPAYRRHHSSVIRVPIGRCGTFLLPIRSNMTAAPNRATRHSLVLPVDAQQHTFTRRRRKKCGRTADSSKNFPGPHIFNILTKL